MINEREIFERNERETRREALVLIEKCLKIAAVSFYVLTILGVCGYFDNGSYALLLGASCSFASTILEKKIRNENAEDTDRAYKKARATESAYETTVDYEAETFDSERRNSKVKRLYKSRTDKKLDGVCGGIAEYFDIDPGIVRLMMILLGCTSGIGVVIYIVADIVMTYEPKTK